jgi:cyd operon protein YbgE
MNPGAGTMRIPYPTPLPARLLSLGLAVALAALILIYPRAIAASIGEVRHGLLSLLMWGMAAGFVHGVGFVPRLWPWRLVFHPLLGWALMGFGTRWVMLNG